MSKLSILYIFMLTSLLTSNIVESKTYYVWKDQGSDKNLGTSWQDAWRTLIHASKSAYAGDTIIIRKSSERYRYIKLWRSGTADKPIIFQGESSANPPTLAGVDKVAKWNKFIDNEVWSSPVKDKTTFLVDNGIPIVKASTRYCQDGQWFWSKKGILYYRPDKGTPEDHELLRRSNGGGVAIGKYSWIVIEDIKCWVGRGACIQITGGHNNVIRRVESKWNWRGVDITNGASHNLIEDVLVEEAREAIYIRNKSSFNTVRNCRAYRNGNPPLWPTGNGDREAVAVGEQGGTVGNVIENCDIAYNGGTDGSAALSCFRSPQTIFRNNNVHDNHGTGIAVYAKSHGSQVIGNTVSNNGKTSVLSGTPGITGITIRNSKDVSVIENKITANYVSADSIWRKQKQYLGPHGGLDIDSTSQPVPTDMSGLSLINNVVTGTIGGPDIHISKRPQLNNIIIIPVSQTPQHLR